MAEFSKQWCELNEPEMPHDFDIMEEFHRLKPGNYVPYICEGFGFVAIGKTDDANEDCILAMPINSESPYESLGMIEWKQYNEIIV